MNISLCACGNVKYENISRGYISNLYAGDFVFFSISCGSIRLNKLNNQTNLSGAKK